MAGVILFLCLFFTCLQIPIHSRWRKNKGLAVLRFFNVDLIELTQYQSIFVVSNSVGRLVFFIENWFGLVKKGMKRFIPFFYIDGVYNDVRKSGNFDYSGNVFRITIHYQSICLMLAQMPTWQNI